MRRYRVIVEISIRHLIFVDVADDADEDEIYEAAYALVDASTPMPQEKYDETVLSVEETEYEE